MKSITEWLLKEDEYMTAEELGWYRLNNNPPEVRLCISSNNERYEVYVLVYGVECAIIYDDIEGQFAIGKINSDGNIIYDGTYETLAECIRRFPDYIDQIK
ncbi:hypothetical protein [Candidatus Thiodiazotropha sp. LNASS1]|uniref:hypothetical protein n=1 Tax=Candidatus Thiodiazotropha sp. LNASS1 TaxID=3096260 RepID=UPI0034876A97